MFSSNELSRDIKNVLNAMKENNQKEIDNFIFLEKLYIETGAEEILEHCQSKVLINLEYIKHCESFMGGLESLMQSIKGGDIAYV
jgi:hypothetical protein